LTLISQKNGGLLSEVVDQQRENRLELELMVDNVVKTRWQERVSIVAWMGKGGPVT
jgi:hypothetical protein